MRKAMMVVTLILGWLLSFPASAGMEETTENGSHGHGIGMTLLWIAAILLAAKLSGLVEKIKFPIVLGELLAGVLLGSLHLFGIDVLEPIKEDQNIRLLAELGVIILLFQVGLESNVSKMMKVGIPAVLVAIAGVVVPFVLLTFVVLPLALPGLTPNEYLFGGAISVATSVAITARVFKDLGKIQSREATVIVAAAVIDDILGLILLSVVSAIATEGSAPIGVITLIALKAFLFLAGSITIGRIVAQGLGKMFSAIHPGFGMKLGLALTLCFVMAFIAQEIGMAPIVGAFASGLILDPVHFRNFEGPKLAEEVEEHFGNDTTSMEEFGTTLEHHRHRHVEDLIEPIGHFLAPIFFVLTGMMVQIETLFDPKTITAALVVTVAAFFGKIVAGIFSGHNTNKLIVGVAMISRGEVGLIFLTIGRGLGVVNAEMFSIMAVMIILSTLIPPPILAWLIKRQKA